MSRDNRTQNEILKLLSEIGPMQRFELNERLRRKCERSLDQLVKTGCVSPRDEVNENSHKKWSRTIIVKYHFVKWPDKEVLIYSKSTVQWCIKVLTKMGFTVEAPNTVKKD